MIDFKKKEYANNMLSQQWVKWVHNDFKPAETNAEKSFNIVFGPLTKHCPICLNINGCCFIKEK